jgi:ADP-ribose pyrophosphatase
MPKVIDIELVADRTATSRCDEGFLRLKRYTARNRRADGSTSREYPLDIVDRPTLDAVAVCAYVRSEARVDVLTRAGLRPAALFRRTQKPALPEPSYLLLEEIVAGVLEPGEEGVAALQKRAAEELHEVADILIEPSRFERLGGPVFMLPGIASEKIHFFCCEVPRLAMVPDASKPAGIESAGGGDGSPLEEGAVLRWRELNEAITACERGEIEDAKTEIGLRRLAAHLKARQADAPIGPDEPRLRW